MEGKRRDEEEMQDSLVVEVGMMVPFPLVSFPCSSCFKILFSIKELTIHIAEMNKDLKSRIFWSLLHSATTVATTFQKSPACLNTC